MNFKLFDRFADHFVVVQIANKYTCNRTPSYCGKAIFLVLLCGFLNIRSHGKRFLSVMFCGHHVPRALVCQLCFR